MNYLAANGAKRVYATTRIIRLNENQKGQTEWFYTNEDLIHEAFIEAKMKFGGETKLFFLEGSDPNTNKFISINDAIKKKKIKNLITLVNCFSYIKQKMGANGGNPHNM